MKSLVIGAGQIGKALFEIFSVYHETYIRDIENLDLKGVDVMHIAFPYSDLFIRQVRKYIRQYKPKLTIIHSSVSIGTTRKLGVGVVHSPERGRFPNLDVEMKKYVKFVGGVNDSDVKYAQFYFDKCQWPTVGVNNPDATEFVKLISNTHLGVEITFRNQVQDMMDKLYINPTVYERWEDTYNEGYYILNQTQLMRPRLRVGPIGGHCIIPCTEILKKRFDSKFFNLVLNEKRNKN